MSKYIRKLVHMEVLEKAYSIPSKDILAYYKLENRNEKFKLTIIVDGIKKVKDQTYIICTILPNNDWYYLKSIGMLKLDNNGKAKEVINIDNSLGKEMIGLIIVGSKDEQIHKSNFITIGYNDFKVDIEKIKIKDINKINKAQLNSDVKKNSTEKNRNVDISKINEKTKINSKNINTKKDLNREYNNLNTIELIKKQLESKNKLQLFDQLFINNQKMNPFENNKNNTEWVRIEMTDLVFLPLESWMLINNAFLINCYKKYKHLLLGRDVKEKVIKLGIPDIYNFKESIIANICGFQEFVCCKNTSPKTGEYGYWIIETIL